MALIKFGGGITAMSGSIAGNTFARNRFGNYVRSRTKPVNPRSNRQVEIRSILQNVANYWSLATMSDAERLAWATYAAAINMKNRLGEVINLTAFNHFIRSNLARIVIGGSLIKAGPSVLTLPGADPTIAAVANNGTQQLSIAFDTVQEWRSETGGFLSVEMGQPQLNTRNFFNGPYRNAGAIAGSVGAPPTSPQLIDAPFTLVLGQKVWVRAKIIRADARVSNPFNTPVVIVGGLLSTYSITTAQAPTPDCTCNYILTGSFNGKCYFKNSVKGYYLWWDAATKWYISTILGTPGTAYWSRTDASPVGLFVKGGTSDKDVTVAAGSHA